MCFFGHNDDYISLPDQEILFSLPFALFGHIEKRSFAALGWRWKKHVVVLNSNGHLFIYKYFLEGIGLDRTADQGYKSSFMDCKNIRDVEQIKISEMITASGAHSEPVDVENILMQSGNTIYGKCPHQKLETNDLVKRSKSASKLIGATEFSIAKEANRSISFDQLNMVLVSRQDRFRKYLQRMIESRFYESLTESSLNYSVSSNQKLHAQAGNLRMLQAYIAYNTLLIKNEVPSYHQITQRYALIG